MLPSPVWLRSQTTPAQVNDGRVNLTSLINRSELHQLLEDTRIDCSAGARQLSRRKKVTIKGRGQGDVGAAASTTAGAASIPVTIWARFQVTRFSREGFMLADAEGQQQE